jgi:hypothetical protein
MYWNTVTQNNADFKQTCKYITQIITLQYTRLSCNIDAGNNGGFDTGSITREEMHKGFTETKTRKAPGCNQLNSELIKYASENIQCRFWIYICRQIKVLRNGYVEKQQFFPCPRTKRRETVRVEKNRVFLSPYKRYEKITVRRLNITSEASLHEVWPGIRKGTFCHYFTLTLIGSYKKMKMEARNSYFISVLHRNI